MAIHVEALSKSAKSTCDACDEKRPGVARIHGRWACFDLCVECAVDLHELTRPKRPARKGG